MIKRLPPTLARKVAKLRKKGEYEKSHSLDGKRRTRIRKTEAKTMLELYNWVRANLGYSNDRAIETVAWATEREVRSVESRLEALKSGVMGEAIPETIPPSAESAHALARAIAKLEAHYADLTKVAEQWRERLVFPKPALLRPHDPFGRLVVESTYIDGVAFGRCYPDMVMHGELVLEDPDLLELLKAHLDGDLILDHYREWHAKTQGLKERCCQLFTRVEKDVRDMVEKLMGDSWADLKGDSSTDLPWALAEWAYDTITVVPAGGVLAGPCSEPWPLNVVKYSEDCPEWSSICRGSLRLATLPSDSAATLMAANEALVGTLKESPEVEEIRKLVDEIGVLYLKLYDEFSFLINSRQVPGRCAYCSSPERS